MSKVESLPWPSCGKSFRDYFRNKYSKWYLKPLKNVLEKIAVDAWDNALLKNGK